MQNVIIVIHLMVVLALVGVVLLQRSEGGGLGMGGGGGGGFMTGRGQANLLTRTTAILAAAFFATSLILTFLAGRTGGAGGSLFAPQPTTAPISAPAGGAPVSTDSLLQQLGGAPAAPAAPAVPAAPAAPAKP